MKKDLVLLLESTQLISLVKILEIIIKLIYSSKIQTRSYIETMEKKVVIP